MPRRTVRPKLQRAVANEYGVKFETGQPVTFHFIRSKEKSPYFGMKFGQDIEPHGRYMLHNPDPGRLDPARWDQGDITFENPLVIPLSGDRHDIYGPTGWKAKLVEAAGVKGKALSQYLRDAGYDGIITVDPDGYTREIVDVTMFSPKRKREPLAGMRRLSRREAKAVTNAVLDEVLMGARLANSGGRLSRMATKKKRKTTTKRKAAPKRKAAKRVKIPNVFCVFAVDGRKKQLEKCAPSKTRAKKIRRHAEKLASHKNFVVKKPTATDVKRFGITG